MSDEVVQETTNGAVDSGQTGDRPRKSRKRGKRNRSRPNEPGLQADAETTSLMVDASPTVASPPRERERSTRRSGGERSGSNGYRDGFDRFFCTSGLRFYPREWPVSHRRGLAIAGLQEVGRRDRELLICDLLHEGACLWPDGEPVVEHIAAPTDSNPEVFSARATTPVAVLEPPMDADA